MDEGVIQEVRQFLREDLARLERLKGDLFREETQLLSPLLDLGSLMQGKRLRPLLLFLCARLGGEVRPIHHPLALIVECIHTATLVHDDILDEGLLRRLDGTFNAKWGNERAVLFGDYILSVAFYLASTLQSPEAFQWIIEATKKTCIGELMQLNEKFNFRLTTDRYLQIIDYKTAKLFAVAGQLGFCYAQGDKGGFRETSSSGRGEKNADSVKGGFPVHLQREAVLNFGTLFGMLYQMMDDAVDFFGEEAQVGKSLGTDLLKGKVTLPLLLLLREASSADQAQAIKALTDSTPKTDIIKELLSHYNIRGRVLDYAGEYVRKATACLAPFPDSEAKQWLLRLTGDIVRL